MTDVVEEFRMTAQMVSIIGHTHMLPIVEHFGYADHMMNSWKLDPNTLKFNFKGILPYELELMEEQPQLLRYVLGQSYSKEMVSVMLNLQKHQKQRCNTLEDQLVNLIIHAMEMTESNENTLGSGFNVPEEQISHNEWIWLHLSCQLIYFVLFQFVSFMHIVLALYDKVGILNTQHLYKPIACVYFVSLFYVALKKRITQGKRSINVDFIAIYIWEYTKESGKFIPGAYLKISSICMSSP